MYMLYASVEVHTEKKNLLHKDKEEKGIKQIWLAEKRGKSYNMVSSKVHNR